MAAGCGQPGGRILREHLTADYATHSFASNPARYASLFDDLPRDLAGISLVTQGLIYHYAADQYVYGYQPPPERLGEIDSRLIETILARILEKDDRPQCEPRAYEDHLLGCCRDFTLLACSVLRHRGTPARVRCGFADYILPEYWIDHVIGETWDGSRWRRFDPEMPASKPLAFAVLDQPEKRFATGGRAWQMIRHEDADPTRFGLGPEVPEPKGAWFIRNRLVLDFAALDKHEMILWDGWGPLQSPEPEPSADDQRLLDRVAALSQQPDVSELRSLSASDPRLRVPETVTCYSPATGPREVKVG
jgi:hypothetical protein